MLTRGLFSLCIIMGHDGGWNLPGFSHCSVRINIFALIQMVCRLQYSTFPAADVIFSCHLPSIEGLSWKAAAPWKSEKKKFFFNVYVKNILTGICSMELQLMNHRVFYKMARCWFMSSISMLHTGIIQFMRHLLGLNTVYFQIWFCLYVFKWIVFCTLTLSVLNNYWTLLRPTNSCLKGCTVVAHLNALVTKPNQIIWHSQLEHRQLFAHF